MCSSHVTNMDASAEVGKLQSHLALLREEYVKLQNRYADLEKRHQVALAASGTVESENFVSRLLQTVADLFDKDLYSDLSVQIDGQYIKAHRFVLAARSDFWGVADLATTSQLDFTDIPYDVGHALLKWVYTDTIDIKSDDKFLLALLKTASKFKLGELRERCEKALISSVNVKNCIQYYQTAEEIGAETLKKHCSELISNHWSDFNATDFVSMPAPLLYSMFKAKSSYPLHTTIRAHREDVLFLYLIEFDSQLPGKLNEIDDKGDLPLDLALVDQLESIADTLVRHRVNTSAVDREGNALIHKAITRGDESSATFLIKNGADVNAATQMALQTALHLCAAFDPEIASTEVIRGMANVTKMLLENSVDLNKQDKDGNTPIHQAVQSKNKEVFETLLNHASLNLELQNQESQTVLWLALQAEGQQTNYGPDCLAAKLVKRGSSTNAVNISTGDALLHRAARSGNEAAGIFLATHGADVTHANNKGETPLHVASEKGLTNLVEILLSKGANPNAQTRSNIGGTPTDFPGDQEDGIVAKQTPLHVAIANRHEPVVKVFLDYKAKATSTGDNMAIIPNFNLKDSNDQTVLGLALWNGYLNIAETLLNGGSNINDVNAEGMTLLHQAIVKQDTPSALFLLQHSADMNVRTSDNETPLQLAIKRHLPVVVDILCQRGANMNVTYDDGDCPLWQALETGQEDVASTLVRHGCDTNMWGTGPEGCLQTLLHRAIDNSNESVGCFLIRSGCDVNSARKPGIGGEGGEEARDGQSPLHLCSQWGLEQLVQTLVEFNANVNAQDAEGKTPLHVAIINQHPVLISLLMSHPAIDLAVRDKQGLTPFAAAMLNKNNRAAEAILARKPDAAEQMDNKGRNFLHTAILNSDIESVLFLIGIQANVNSKVMDSQQLSPLHLAVQVGSEMIVRNLLLAGAMINDVTPQSQTTLHLAAIHDRPVIASILIENNINYDAVDSNANTALHLACYHGHVGVVKSLLTESRINAEAVNAKGMTAMHNLGQYGKDSAAAIFELFVQCMPDYPIDKPDDDGNTVLLLAYMNGNGALCRAVVKQGACMATINRQGYSIFNFPVATKQLLVKLLDMLSKEPPWSDGDTCNNCHVKFGIKTRKHHCRHCGRLLCSKCSDKDMPIIKFNLPKPVRVCDVCFDVLTLGS
ncbi:unnamed protein product [Owenia fusiformis]|uniref:Ankyrin repeat and FYVE domain-containing protein 1 n=1 Tax=Owenia fusiformis TaxID=6347 RepID=A0A8S4Q577_OWEFU|nr:unnamed protein product [Owenia fusiformis]